MQSECIGLLNKENEDLMQRLEAANEVIRKLREELGHQVEADRNYQDVLDEPSHISTQLGRKTPREK